MAAAPTPATGRRVAAQRRSRLRVGAEAGGRASPARIVRAAPSPGPPGAARDHVYSLRRLLLFLVLDQ